MASVLNTIAAALILGDANNSDIDVSNVLNQAPLIAALNSVQSSNGSNHSYIRTTAAPGVGYRAVNTGRVNAAETIEQVDIVLKYLDAGFTVDVALAKAQKDQQAYMARRMQSSLQAGFFAIEQQSIYGTGADAGGSTGLASTLSAVANSQVIDAGDATADSVTSVYAVRSSDEGVSVVYKDGEIMFDDEPSVSEVVTDTGTGASYPAYVVPCGTFLGLQLGSTYDSARLANIGTAAANTLTDDMLAELVETAKAGMGYTHLVMNRKAREQLRKSRTATNATGAPATTPSEFEGIPIIVSDAVSLTEAVVV